MATVQELEQMLRDAKAAAYEEDLAKRSAQREAWRILIADPDNWEWRVEPRTTRYWPGDDEDPLEGLFISKRVKREPLAAWAANGPSTCCTEAQAGNWTGMFYYRTDENILTNNGGGTYVLQTPKICSDADWAELAAGRIPEKFLRKPK